ncbi:DUF3068 domain-containing protein [Corynebacterium poyangense]|nr:DUF3068 domain-containing protein [Corynebacterium poyangense]
MLPRSRIFGILLIGVGVALAAAGLLGPRVIHLDARVPLDVEENTMRLHDSEAKSRIVGDPDAGVVVGPMVRQLHTTVQEPVDEDNATMRVGVSVRREQAPSEAEGLTTAQVWDFGIDRRTGKINTQMRVSDQIASPPADISANCWWLNFPPNPEQTTYQIFDDTLRRCEPAVFRGEEDVAGRPAYHYYQRIDPTNVAQEYNGPFTITHFSDGREGYLYHSADRDVWVDQETGMLLKLSENIDDYYGDAHANRVEDNFTFHGRMPEQDVSARAEASAEVAKRGVVGIIFQVLKFLGAVLILGGLGVTFWPRGKARR